MPVIRAFIAIEIPKIIQDELGAINAELKSLTKSEAIRWVVTGNIHITLKFLGEISSTTLELLSKMMRAEVARYNHFDLSFEGFGAFPTTSRPRVIWVGISSSPQLLALQKGVETETIRLGYSPEQRGFSPHLTLARISHNASPAEIQRIGRILLGYNVGKVGSYEVTNVVLFKSDLLPGGPVYTPISAFPLNLRSQVAI